MKKCIHKECEVCNPNKSSETKQIEAYYQGFNDALNEVFSQAAMSQKFYEVDELRQLITSIMEDVND